MAETPIILPLFSLENYFAKYEFNTKYLLCCSDAETFSMEYLLSIADSECLKLWGSLKLNYTETKGFPLLNQEISNIYKPYKSCEANNILCFAGAEEGIYATMKGILNINDHVIIVTPCYQSLQSIPMNLCAETSSIDLSIDYNWNLDIHKLTGLIRPNTKMIIINFPHNPTGSVISSEILDRLILLARKHNIWIFSDEVYRGIESDPKNLRSPVVSLYEKGISLGVTSKSFGLAGLRIGWIVMQDINMLNHISNVKHYLSLCNSAPSEILALIALRNKDVLLERNTRLAKSNQILFEEFLDNWKGVFSWVPPKGGCVGFVKYCLKGKLTLKELAEVLIREYGILILPGEHFPSHEIDISDHFRLGFGRENFKEALAAFQEALLSILSDRTSDSGSGSGSG